LTVLLVIDAAALVVMIAAEQCTLVVMGRRYHRMYPQPPA
jgi:hypothetical protein